MPSKSCTRRAHDPQERAKLAHERWLTKRMRPSRVAAHQAQIHDWLIGRQPEASLRLNVVPRGC